MQFGYGIASWSNLSGAFARAKGYDGDDDTDKKNNIDTIV